MIAFFNQFSGINAFLYYSPRIFQEGGLGENSAFLSSIGIGVTNLIFTIIGISLIDKVGRKVLMIIGSIGYIISLTFIFLIPEIAVSIRRLHDINKSGWWILLTITIIGIIPLTYFYCIKGDDGVNDYGQPN